MAIRIIAGKQARPGHRRVRHAAQPFREVLHAVPRIGVGPGMVEHEFTVRVVLEITRRCSDQFVATPQGQMLRLPTPFRTQATVLLQSTQECMADEGIAVVVQRVPGGCRDECERCKNPELGRHGCSCNTSTVGGLNSRSGRPISPTPRVVNTRTGPCGVCANCSPRSKPYWLGMAL
ncbi:hypothetical protein D3C71_1293450 [compost metagenome]